MGGHSALPFCTPALYSRLVPPTGETKGGVATLRTDSLSAGLWQPNIYIDPIISGPVILDTLNRNIQCQHSRDN